MPNYLTPNEVKAEELAMLVEFVDLCKREGLRYSLAGGTLLGAVRHKGFIPWDDDIDLVMFREELRMSCAVPIRVCSLFWNRNASFMFI